MKDKNLDFTLPEIKKIKKYDYIKKMKSQRTLYWLRSFGSLLFSASFSYNSIRNITENDILWAVLFGFFAILYFTIAIVHFYNIRIFGKIIRKIRKYNKQKGYKDDYASLLKYIGQEKLNKCKKLISNKGNELAVEYYYNEFKSFADKSGLSTFNYRRDIEKIDKYLNGN